MKRKLFGCLAFILMICMFLCSSCKPKQEINYDYQKGFSHNDAQTIVKTQDGYYFLLGNYIYYMDKEFSKGTILCSKPECLHEKEQIDYIINCDGFFSSPTSIGYYDGYLYVSAEDFTSQERNTVIYKVSLDGVNRKIIYNGSEYIQRVVIHRGKCYIYERAFDKEGSILMIYTFSLDNSQTVTKLYEERYKDAHINYMICYEENCYFVVVDWSTGELVTRRKGINLEDGTISEYCTFATGPIQIDKNGIYCSKATTIDTGEYVWENEYYYCGIDGNDKIVLTEEQFPPIAQNATLYRVDENYIYFLDIYYGELAVPEEERRLYIYTYDGELAATIKTGGLAGLTVYYSGVKNVMIIKSSNEGEYIYYYVDKETFCGEEVKPKEILRIGIDEMSPAFSITYDK